MNINFKETYQPHPKQLEAHKDANLYLLFGGAMGGGKSWFLSAEAVMNAMKYNGNRLAIVRKIRAVMKKTILVTFFQVCPPQLIKSFNQQDLTVTFVNGSVLIFMEADKSKDPLLNKIKGLEIGWAGIDEANEVDEQVFNILKSRLRWKCPNGQIPNYQIRLTSNPENCWLIPRFIEKPEPNHKFVQSLTTDNYDENSDYVKQLYDAYKHNPELLERYLMGQWAFGSTVAQLIRNELIDFMFKPVAEDAENRFACMGIDVARFGDDYTAFFIMEGGWLVRIEVWTKTSIPDVAKRALMLMQDYDIDAWRVGVDVVGLGAGVVDMLIEAGQDVCAVSAGAKAEVNVHSNEFKFLIPYNLRAQMFMALRNDMGGGIIGGLGHGCEYWHDGQQVLSLGDDLRKELGWIEYKIPDGKKLRILRKEELKKKHGKSPDLADGLAIANWMRRKEFSGFTNLF